MFENFDTAAEELWKVWEIQIDFRDFNHFDYTRYAIDVTFKQSNRLSGII